MLRLCPYVLWRRVRAGCTVSECVMCTVTAISDSASLPIHNIYINTRHTSGEMIISIIADAPDQDRRLITIWRFLPCSGSFFSCLRARRPREKNGTRRARRWSSRLVCVQDHGQPQNICCACKNATHVSLQHHCS